MITDAVNTSLPFWYKAINSSPPGQDSCYFADDAFKCIFLNKKFCISVQIALKFVPKGPIDNNPALV